VAFHKKSVHKKRMVFQPRDLIWVHLRKKRFPSKCNSKLMPRAYDPFEILERVNSKAYKVDLPRDYYESAIFNMLDLIPHSKDTYLVDLRANSL